MGNVIALRYRLEMRGYSVTYIPLDSLKTLTENNIDILVGGGGQDSNQNLIQEDLQKYAAELKAQCDDGLVCLMVCGMYQLFGNKFILSDGSELTGASIIDLETRAGTERLIGNVVIDTTYGRIVGFENHSGRTYLGSGVQSLGKVIKGAGNNGETHEEGAIVNNVFGTYMHGPVLTKNPVFADELISRVLNRASTVAVLLDPLDDFIELSAATQAIRRPR